MLSVACGAMTFFLTVQKMHYFTLRTMEETILKANVRKTDNLLPWPQIQEKITSTTLYIKAFQDKCLIPPAKPGKGWSIALSFPEASCLPIGNIKRLEKIALNIEKLLLQT